MNTIWWGVAHVLATISHFIMGIVGIITFNNTAIQALEDFWSGAALGASPVRQVGEASLLQGITAVVSQVPFSLGLAHGCQQGGADHKKKGMGGICLQLDIFPWPTLDRPQDINPQYS